MVKHGVGYGRYPERVNTLALKANALQRSGSSRNPGLETKKRTAADKAQKLMLTWLVNYPGILNSGEHISLSDFGKRVC